MNEWNRSRARIHAFIEAFACLFVVGMQGREGVKSGKYRWL
jgi:hypothetical protein